MSRCVPVLAALLLCALGACGPEVVPDVQDLVGTYKGKLNRPVGNQKNIATEAVITALEGHPLSLELRDDMTYTLTIGMGAEGTWSLSGSTVTLTAEEFAEVNLPQFDLPDEPVQRWTIEGNELVGQKDVKGFTPITFIKE